MSTSFTQHAAADIGKIFEPDALSSFQFYSTVGPNHRGDPERRLMIAVLEDVVTCLSIDPDNCSARQRMDFYDAHAWINAPRNSNWIFSFSNICESLGLDPDYLRRGLNSWIARPERRTSRRSPRHKQFRIRGVS